MTNFRSAPLVYANDREGSQLPVVVRLGDTEHLLTEEKFRRLLNDAVRERKRLDLPKTRPHHSWPSRKADWVGLQVQVRHPMANGWGQIPRGVVLTITSTGGHGQIHLKGERCECCGLRPTITVRGTLRCPPVGLWPIAKVVEEVVE